MIIDPWENKEIILSLNNTLENTGKNIIKGPFTSKKERYEIEFNYYYDSTQMCGILYTVNKTNNYNNIFLRLYQDIAIIQNISRSNIYRGSEYMLLALQIIYKLKYKKSMLQDLAYFNCDRKMNFFSNSNIPISKKINQTNKNHTKSYK